MSSTIRPERPVLPIVVGCGRSGTTLLRSMLDSHPSLAMSMGRWPLDLWARRARYERPNGFDLGRFAQDLIAVPQFDALRIEPDWVRAALAGVEPIGYGEAWRRVFALYAQARGKTRVGHKNPGFVEHVETVASWWPEARFVHIHRDGRDVALSLVEQGWGPNNVAGAARWWDERVRAGRRGGYALGADRYLEVLYADLVAEPEATLRRVCGFVELDYDPAMVAYHERAMTDIPVRFRHRHVHVAEAPTAGIRDWRRDMPDRAVGVFEAVAGRTLVAFGYERRFHTVPLLARGAAGWQLVRSRVRTLVRRWPAARAIARKLRRAVGTAPATAGRP
jgi:hypothetical protein